MSKKQKAPLRATGGKHTKRETIIHSLSNKVFLKNSIWNVACEGESCGWTAQFATGREATEAGWQHHKSVYHSRKFRNSTDYECPSTQIFKVVTEKHGFPVSSGHRTGQITSDAIQNGIPCREG